MEATRAKHIPEEMVLNILWKVTEEEALARFKCVSKQWLRWICDIINTRPKRQRLIVMPASMEGQFVFKTMQPKSRQLQNMAAAAVPWKPYKYTQIYGSCNGFLLVGYGNDLFLWNPLTRYVEKICYFKRWDADQMVGGLCFDSSTNEYKVVIALIEEPLGGDDFVVVGSPKNKTWTQIEFPYCPETVGSGPVLHNRLHWFASCSSSDPYVIIYFDTKTDTFLELPMPLVGDAGKNYVLGLGVLDGCLCMTRPKNYSVGVMAEVLVMKEYGVRDSWAVLFRINGDCFHGEIVPFFYVDEGKSEVCMKITDHSKWIDRIIVYDINADSQIELDSVRHWHSCSVTFEVSSETPIGGDWEELESRGEAYYSEIHGPECKRTMTRRKHVFWCMVTEELEGHQHYFKDYKEEEEEEEEEWEVPKRSKCKKKSVQCDSLDSIPTRNTFDILGHCQPLDDHG